MSESSNNPEKVDAETDETTEGLHNSEKEQSGDDEPKKESQKMNERNDESENDENESQNPGRDNDGKQKKDSDNEDEEDEKEKPQTQHKRRGWNRKRGGSSQGGTGHRRRGAKQDSSIKRPQTPLDEESLPKCELPPEGLPKEMHFLWSIGSRIQLVPPTTR